MGSDTLLLRPILSSEVSTWNSLIRTYHYLQTSRIGGEVLRYVATRGQQWVALLGWGSAALKCSARDTYIGWDAPTRQKRLYLVANNVRFLILPWVQEHNLASRVLGENLRRLSQDWQRVHGHPLYLAETFVDISRYPGTCYRAANWRQVGLTRGWSRKGKRWEHNGQPKAVFVYPLRADARQLLTADFVVADGGAGREGGMEEVAKNLAVEGLMEKIRSFPDPRKPRGVRHQVAGVLGIAVCAVLCGARGYRAIGQWAEGLGEDALRRFDTGRHEPPSESTIRRVLQAIDAEKFDEHIGEWIRGQSALRGKAVAVDGKTLRGSCDTAGLQVHLLSAVVQGEGLVLAQREVDKKTNEITQVKPLLEKLDLEGAVVTTDALLTQRELAGYLVKDKKADYLFTVKDNQPTMRKDIEDLQLKKNLRTPATSPRRTGDRNDAPSGSATS